MVTQAQENTHASAGGPAIRFGLIVIGDEVLNGAREDRHLASFKQTLARRGHELAWYWLLPDDPIALTSHLRRALADAEPFFCCGGIGATPDDYTRACAAAAADVDLVRHADAQQLIEARFAAAAWPHRVRMADLPAGCGLIPNPVNAVPGFSLDGRAWFLPGFPAMAGPMAEWVLDQCYGQAERLREVAFKVHGVPESRLIPLMRALGAAYPEFKLFSLPHMGEQPHVLLGARGRADPGAIRDALRVELAAAGIEAREWRGGD